MIQNKKFSLFAAGLIAASTLSLTALPADAATTTGAVSHASGFNIKTNGNVTGGWVGTLAVKTSTGNYGSVYADPTKKPGTTYNFDKISYTNDIDGAYAGPTAKNTARIAYILGKWGVGNKSAVTGAAVDLSVNTLMRPGSKYAYNKSVGKARAKKTRNYNKVINLTKKFLAESSKMSGPYQTTLRATGTSGNINVRFSIKTISGKALAGRSVLIKVGDSDPTTVKTDSNGKVNLVLGNQPPGENPITATVQNLPDWRVPVAPSLSSKNSRILIAPAKVNVTKTTTGKTTGDQLVTISPVNPVVLGTNVRGNVAVNGWGGDRNLTTNLYGPFATLDEANTNACTGTPTATSSQVINEDGTFKLVETTSQLGYWRYSVAVAGNSTNNAFNGCSNVFVVKSQAHVAIARSSANVTKGKATNGIVTVSGLPDATKHTITVRLYGPYSASDNVGCGSGKLYKQVTLNVTGNGTYNTSKITMNQTGWYGWSASIDGSEFAIADGYTCPPTGTSRFQVVN